MSTLTATADATSGTVRLDVEQTQVRDLFTRVVAGGWGSATTGQAWTVLTTGGPVAGDYSVNGTQGLHTFSSTNTPRLSSVTTAADADMAAWIQVTIPVAALTQPIQPSLAVRFTDSNNYYFAELSLAPAGTATLKIRRRVLGVETDLTTALTLGQVHAAGATWNIMIDVCGSQIRAKAWRSTVSQPDWLLTATNTALSTGTSSAVRSVLATGNTNGSTVFTYDNFVAWISQPIRLWRVLPDATRTEVRGSPGYTEPPTAAAATGIATFYDNESPFDTSMTYELTSNCNTVVEAVSGAVTLASNGNGWMRDPEDPSKNIVLSFSNLAFNNCTGIGEIALLDWDSRTRRNASGQFDTVNSVRGRFVAMTRKSYDSKFLLASKELTDIDLITALLAPGKIIMVSLPSAYGFGRPYGSDYISVGDLVEIPVNTDNYTDPQRYWDVPFRLEYAPADLSEGMVGGNGIGGGDATYGELAASALGATYGTLAASGETYQQVAQGVGY